MWKRWIWFWNIEEPGNSMTGLTPYRVLSSSERSFLMQMSAWRAASFYTHVWIEVIWTPFSDHLDGWADTFFVYVLPLFSWDLMTMTPPPSFCSAVRPVNAKSFYVLPLQCKHNNTAKKLLNLWRILCCFIVNFNQAFCKPQQCKSHNSSSFIKKYKENIAELLVTKRTPQLWSYTYNRGNHWAHPKSERSG